MGGNRLVIVSNHAPLPSAGAADGGFAAVVNAAAEEGESVLWFGWSGRVSDEASSVVSLWRNPSTTVVAIDLTTRQFESHLCGFSNCTIWPLFHGFPERVTAQPHDLALHRAVNAHFAEQLLPLLRPGDRIWIQDFHLIPLGWILRQAGVEAPIGFFLHTPFAHADSLLRHPWHRKLAGDLAAYDLVGLQTTRDRFNFIDFMQRAGHSGATRRPAVVVQPAAIHTRSIMDVASSSDVEKRVERFARSLKDTQVIIAADRLDYTKGLIERFQAYETLLEQAPDCQRQSCLVQVTAPSRPLVPGYLELRMEQQAQALRINERFWSYGWMPIYDIYANLPRRSLLALFRLGRVGMVTPISEGGSLVAREYVAAQNPRDPGVLVLSRRSGAADLLTEALIVDPDDTAQMADRLHAALRMPLDERQDRWQRLMVKLLHHDAVQWSHGFLSALGRAHRTFNQPPVSQPVARRRMKKPSRRHGPRISQS